MQLATLAPNETERLAALRAVNILDTPPEERFDRITKLASEIFNVPFASVSMVDKDRLWIKSKYGLNLCEMKRKTSLCGHTVLGDKVFTVPDTTQDSRFADNPLVINDPFIRFYAGYPLEGPQGHKIGTLCISDIKPRIFNENSQSILRQLGKMVENELNLVDTIKLQSDLISTKGKLIESQAQMAKELTEAAAYVRSLLPKPLAGEIKTEWGFAPSSNLGGDAFGYHWLDKNHFAIYVLDVTGHGIGAALLSVSVMNILRAQSLPLTDFTRPGEVLRNLNETFQMQHHGEKGFTIWYGVYDKSTRQLTYSSAGHPPAILVTPEGVKKADLERLEEGGIMVGALSGLDYPVGSKLVEHNSKLLVFSDGIFEFVKSNGERWSFDGFMDYLKELPVKDININSLLSEIRKQNTQGTFEDDVSLIEAVFN